MSVRFAFPFTLGGVPVAAVVAAVVVVAGGEARGQTTDSTGPAVARLEVRLADLERELRATTGRIEETNFRLRQLSERLDKLVADVDYRLARLGAAEPGATGAPGPAGPDAGMPSPPPFVDPRTGDPGAPMVLGRLPRTELGPRQEGSPPPVVAPPPAEAAAAAGDVLPRGTPREQYAYAFGLMRKSDYDEAEAVFKAFLDAHPDDPLAENARYWLGETYYVRGDYARAAETFLDGYQRNKTGAKAPDVLLKLGMSLAALGKNKEACATYGELRKSLPDAPATVRERTDKERQRIGCR